jgi:hypothetical protein
MVRFTRIPYFIRQNLRGLEVPFPLSLPTLKGARARQSHSAKDRDPGRLRLFQEARKGIDNSPNIGHLFAEFKSKIERLDLLQPSIVDPAEHQPGKPGDCADNPRHSADYAKRPRARHCDHFTRSHDSERSLTQISDWNLSNWL